MKRWICVMLSALLVMFSVAGAEISYTLPEKMDKQLSIGSGLKGSFTLTAEGNHPVIPALNRFNGTEYQIRGMKNEESTHYYIYREGENEALLDRTELYTTPGMIYFRGDQTGDKVYSFTAFNDLLNRLSAPAGGNPSFLSAAVNLLREEAGDSILKKYTDELEIWINQFADQTEALPGSGTAAVEMSYTIPAGALRREILTLLTEAAEDPETIALMNSVMTDEQKETYFNHELEYFYEEALKGFESEYDIVLSRRFTVKGEELSSTIEIPLNRELYGWRSLMLENENGKTTVNLENENEILTIILDKIPDIKAPGNVEFWIIKRPADHAEEAVDYLSAHGNLTITEEKSEDEDGRSHETTRWEMKVERDVSMLPEGESADKYPEFEPVRFELALHYSSKYPQSSPTTLEITGGLSFTDLSLKLNATVKTASPWIFTPFDVTGAEDLLQLTTEEQTAIMMKLLGNDAK